VETSHTAVEARLLAAALPPHAVAVDAGCGRTTRLAAWRDTIAELIGLDVDGAAGVENGALDRFINADLCGRLPMADATVDLVYANFVVEHLGRPSVAFAEWYRILRAGGCVVVLTSNIADPLVWAASKLPRYVVVALKRIGAGAVDRDVVPTLYRANTVETLDAALRGAGFAAVEVHLVGTLHRYAGRRRAAAAALTAFERLLPARRRSTIVALYVRD
jgi:SAM-dependent methyltransferase